MQLTGVIIRIISWWWAGVVSSSLLFHTHSLPPTCAAMHTNKTPSGEVYSLLAFRRLLHQHWKLSVITLCSLCVIQQAEIIITMETVHGHHSIDHVQCYQLWTLGFIVLKINVWAFQNEQRVHIKYSSIHKVQFIWTYYHITLFIIWLRWRWNEAMWDERVIKVWKVAENNLIKSYNDLLIAVWKTA